MLSFQHLSSFCAVLSLLLGPVRAGLDNTTSPTSLFRSVSHEHETLHSHTNVISDRISTLPSSASISLGRIFLLRVTSSLHRTGTLILDRTFTTTMDSSFGPVLAHWGARRPTTLMSASTRVRTTSASFKGTSTTDGRADMALL